MAPNAEDLYNWFSYHAPTPTQADTYIRLRNAAKNFAFTILADVPDCADKTHALRTVREAMMWANAAVACSSNEVAVRDGGAVSSK